QPQPQHQGKHIYHINYNNNNTNNNKVRSGFVHIPTSIKLSILYTSMPGLQFARTQGGKDSVRTSNHEHLEVDTGSDGTIVSDEAWKALGGHKLNTFTFKVSRAAGDAVKLSGAMQ
ncbi:unnamed protein product, partial [Hymenolepis diminuta]